MPAGCTTLTTVKVAMSGFMGLVWHLVSLMPGFDCVTCTRTQIGKHAATCGYRTLLFRTRYPDWWYPYGHMTVQPDVRGWRGAPRVPLVAPERRQVRLWIAARQAEICFHRRLRRDLRRVRRARAEPPQGQTKSLLRAGAR
jgi:hypothetical protein